MTSIKGAKFKLVPSCSPDLDREMDASLSPLQSNSQGDLEPVPDSQDDKCSQDDDARSTGSGAVGSVAASSGSGRGGGGSHRRAAPHGRPLLKFGGFFMANWFCFNSIWICT